MPRDRTPWLCESLRLHVHDPLTQSTPDRRKRVSRFMYGSVNSRRVIGAGQNRMVSRSEFRDVRPLVTLLSGQRRGCLWPKSDRGVGRRYERRDHALPTFVLTADPDDDLATNPLMPWNLWLRIALR